jgi:chromosome segregation ATPase
MELNIFEIMCGQTDYKNLKGYTARLFDNYISLSHEYDRIKGENTRLKQRSEIDRDIYVKLIEDRDSWRNRFDTLVEQHNKILIENDVAEAYNKGLTKSHDKLKERYYELEQKYWDAQRLIDKYEQENSDLKSKLDWEKSVSEYLGEQLDDIYESRIEQECTKCQIKYEKVLMEREKLRNELSAERIKSEEMQKYLEAYQSLYVDECMKNRKAKKDGKDSQS